MPLTIGRPRPIFMGTSSTSTSGLGMREELQNGGTNNFSLKRAGRPTTGAPGTFQNPEYTPLNLSHELASNQSAPIPNNTGPFAMSEWRGYNHSAAIGCKAETYHFITTTLDSTIYLYNFERNTILRTSSYIGNDSDIKSSFAITRNKFWYTTRVSSRTYDTAWDYQVYDIYNGSFIFFNGLTYSSFPIDPSSPRVLVYEDGNTLSKERFDGFFAKDDSTLLYRTKRYNSGTGITSSHIVEIRNIPPFTSLGTFDLYDLPFVSLFSIGPSYFLSSNVFFNSSDSKYYLGYSTGGDGVAPHYVGRYTSTGTLEASVPVSSSSPVNGILSSNGNLYAISQEKIYALDFSGLTSSYVKSAPATIVGVTQYSYPNSNFTTPTIGTFYTYYRFVLRGEVNYEADIDVTGNSTTAHVCQIYLNYPFNDVGQINITPWTYSLFDTSTTKTITRKMQSNSEVLHFVFFEQSY